MIDYGLLIFLFLPVAAAGTFIFVMYRASKIREQYLSNEDEK